MPALTAALQHSTGSSSQHRKARKWNRRHTDQKGKNKTVPDCRWHTVYVENHKESTTKLLEVISEFIKVVEYKINIQKLIVFLYTNNEYVELK